MKNTDNKEYIHELLDRSSNLYDITMMMLVDHPAVSVAGVEKEVNDVLESLRILYDKIDIE